MREQKRKEAWMDEGVGCERVIKGAAENSLWEVMSSTQPPSNTHRHTPTYVCTVGVRCLLSRKSDSRNAYKHP